jgi:putative hydrolases of HD superfamily
VTESLLSILLIKKGNPYPLVQGRGLPFSAKIGFHTQHPLGKGETREPSPRFPLVCSFRKSIYNRDNDKVRQDGGISNMGIHTYFQSLNKLERIVRCPGEFKLEEHNVASHSWKVSQYAQLLGTVEEQNGVEINWKSLYEKSINHDFGEVFIGDIKTPVKYASQNLRHLLGQVEEGMVKQFVEKEFPEELKAIYLDRLKEGKDQTIEGKILAVADKLDQIYEAYNELIKGNTEQIYVQIYRDALTKVKEINLHCVRYFIQNILPEMLDESTNTTCDIRKITEEILAR